jgi:hypothetical protein
VGRQETQVGKWKKGRRKEGTRASKEVEREKGIIT